MDDRDLITVARSWPADEIDRTIILDLADALEAWIDAAPITPDLQEDTHA